MNRVRVIGGGWVERVGCEGVIVEPTPEQAKTYPFHGLGRNEVVIQLDDDPLICRIDHDHRQYFCNSGSSWSMVIATNNVETIS